MTVVMTVVQQPVVTLLVGRAAVVIGTVSFLTRN